MLGIRNGEYHKIKSASVADLGTKSKLLLEAFA